MANLPIPNVLKKRSQSIELEAEGNVLNNIGLLKIWVTLLKTPCANFWGRKWNLLDIVTAAFWLMLVLGYVTGFGITLSYHRNLAHRSFRLPKLLEYLFAYCGVLSVQGSPIEWVSTHRYHHQFTDTEKDAHSPLKGFWYSHMGWILDSRSRFGRYGGLRNVEDLKKQPFYVFLHHTLLLHSFLLGWREDARQGLEWWQQIDVTWYIIKFLEALGLATDVKTPSEAHKQRMKAKSMAAQE
ncbi:hypothetical protein DVH24_018517 [Malus domestica]|uniref:Fatty acid desaturase domain-containing protein n=1 Tax=Malus domestica TaxID=3750 RepID=A0A498KL28_MALDO|nr:hypothetical protein DVH24_018517 [Malus domestica]